MTDMAARFAALDGPHRRGDAAEAIVKGRFLLYGHEVLEPTTDNRPYDFVVRDGESEFHRIQCKTAYEADEGVVRFETRSTRVKTTGYDREDYHGKTDYFAVYNPYAQEVYVVDVDEAPSATMTIRTSEGEYRSRRSNWREDYLLGETLTDSSAGEG